MRVNKKRNISHMNLIDLKVLVLLPSRVVDLR